VYDKYKNHPNFAMYDIYHWEAHPNTTYPEPANVQQRVPHYEAYLKKYTFITLPGLVDDGSGKNCIVSKKWNANYTTIVTVGLDTIVKYRKDFPSNFTNAYSGLDSKIAELLPQVGTMNYKTGAGSDLRLLHTAANGDIILSVPWQVHYTFGMYTLTGRRFFESEGISDGRYNLSEIVSAGNYIIRVFSEDNGSFALPVVIKK